MVSLHIRFSRSTLECMYRHLFNKEKEGRGRDLVGGRLSEWESYREVKRINKLREEKELGVVAHPLILALGTLRHADI